MKVRYSLVGVTVFLLTLALGTVQQVRSAQDGKKFEDTGNKTELAGGIDFNKALGLPFESLHSLGGRIDQARRAADPVGLASAAHELHVAEHVSKKKAPLTAEAVMKEAVVLAKMRHESAELSAVALLAHHEAGLVKELTNEAARAKKHEDEEIAKSKEGSRTKGVQGTVHFDSRTNISISCYIDGRFVGSMGPYGDLYIYAGQTPWETTYLSARGSDGRTWNRAVKGSVGDFHWILNP